MQLKIGFTSGAIVPRATNRLSRRERFDWKEKRRPEDRAPCQRISLGGELICLMFQSLLTHAAKPLFAQHGPSEALRRQRRNVPGALAPWRFRPPWQRSSGPQG